ncbi:MAG: hypothetical protein BWK80_51370, partial [Desulfobacteraceae bacterium IS3]
SRGVFRKVAQRYIRELRGRIPLCPKNGPRSFRTYLCTASRNFAENFAKLCGFKKSYETADTLRLVRPTGSGVSDRHFITVHSEMNAVRGLR